MNKQQSRTGMVLGKFMPPHKGHEFLLDFAKNYVTDLYIVVGSLDDEPIDGAVRHQWVQDMFPHETVLHLTDENPQTPDEHPEFWEIWEESLKRTLPEPIDVVFASEDYGWQLADVLDAQFVPVDVSRDIMPISGTAVRNDPVGNWEYLPTRVQQYYLKKICLVGPESTGKSQLARNLARFFNTNHVPEYAEGLIRLQGGTMEYDDIERIARGQMALEDALSKNAYKVMFCDTDPLTTLVWSDFLYDKHPDWLRDKAEERLDEYDLYFLLNHEDVPFEDDEHRMLPERQNEFFERIRSELERYDAPYTIIDGDWQDRFDQGVEQTDALLNPERNPDIVT